MKTIDYYKVRYNDYEFYRLSNENRRTIINELISQEFVDKLLDIANTLGYEVKQQSLIEHIFNYEDNKLSFLHCLHQALGLKGFRNRKTPKQIRSLWVDNCHLDCLYQFYHEYKKIMKTIKEWFESVENPILRKVLLMRYNELHYKTGEPKNIERLNQALFHCFSFSKSIEGQDFWTNVYLDLCSYNESKTFNEKYPVMQVEWLDENECIKCKTEEEYEFIKQLFSNFKKGYYSVEHESTNESKSIYFFLNKIPDVRYFKRNYTIYPAKLFIKNMKPQTLTLGKLRDIFNEDSCLEWKSKILNYLEKYIYHKDNYIIEIEQKDLDYAKKHASKAQLKLLQDAGLKIEKECPFKIGDWIINPNSKEPITDKIIEITDDYYRTSSYLKNQNCLGFNRFNSGLRKATEAEIKYAQIEWDKLKTGSVVKLKEFSLYFSFNKPFDVVFYNQPFYINASSMEFGKTKSNNYCVIHQNSCYCNLNPSEFKKLITEVISY